MYGGTPAREAEFDLAIVGAGVLGVNLAHWMSKLYNCSIALIDGSPGIAQHTSSRNTGVVHRPFYLDPKTKGTFAACAELSHAMWKDLAIQFALPWKETGTIEVAQTDQDVATLSRYKEWGEENGMQEGELQLLSPGEVRALEPEVDCKGAIFSKSDVSTDFGSLTRCVYAMAAGNGVAFLGNSQVREVREDKDGRLSVSLDGGDIGRVRCRFLMNSGGGGAIDIAHMMGVGTEYTDLHFRGDYWLVDDPFASRVSRNVYSVARHSQFPFLDPHFVVRADGTRQIGPNAALVAGPFTYAGLGFGILAKLLERPLGPKLRLFTDGSFLSLVWGEWRSSASKAAMCSRVKGFVPGLDPSFLSRRGLSGVRSSVIDGNGFVPEAILLESGASFHVLNFNSPGATGAPAFSASIVKRLQDSGFFQGLHERSEAETGWNFREVVGRLERF